MNRILSVGMAAIAATFLAQPVYADKGGGHGGGGGGKGGGNGGGHAAAPAKMSVARAPQMHANVMKAPSAPRVTQSRPQFNNRSAPIAPSRPEKTFTPSLARTRAFEQRGHAPAVAFGGHVIDNNNNAAVNARNGRGVTTTPSSQFATRGNSRDFRPPNEMSRHWDHGRMHEWNRHHYRFSGGNWVIIDPGFANDYGYGYGYYDEPTTYSSPAYSYDYSSSESVAASVQDRLLRLGYSPGPVDGVIGAQTRDALADFQGDYRLPVTGQIDTATLRALGL